MEKVFINIVTVFIQILLELVLVVGLRNRYLDFIRNDNKSLVEWYKFTSSLILGLLLMSALGWGLVLIVTNLFA